MATGKDQKDQGGLFDIRGVCGIEISQLRAFGQQGQKVPHMVLRITADGVSPRAVATLLGTTEQQAIDALWEAESLKRGIAAHKVQPRLRLVESIASEATFTSRHQLTIEGIGCDDHPERVELIKGIRIRPVEGLQAEIECKVTIKAPRHEFLAGLTDALSRPMPILLLQDPELPFPDVNSKGDQGEGDDDDGAGDLL